MNNRTTRTGRLLMLLMMPLLVATLACSGLTALLGDSRGGSQGDQGSSPDADDDGAIAVEAREFSFALETSEAAAGEITFNVKNEGTMVHDFAISGNGVEEQTAEIEPGESATLTVTLEPGTYTYICTIPGHEQLGMRGTFTVTSS